MISVLRQEWKARKQTIALISVALFIIAAVSIPAGIIGVEHDSAWSLFPFFVILLTISSILLVGFVVLLPLFQGAGYIGKDLLSDRGYLLLSLPKKPLVIFTGKMIIGLAEFLIYAVPAFFYLTFAIPLAAVLFDSSGSETYGEILQNVFRLLIIDNILETLGVCFSVIVFFICAQTILNFAVVLYRSFMRSRKAVFWIILLSFAAGSVMMQSIQWLSFAIFPLRQETMSFSFLWFFTGICALFSLVYFFITVILFERKIEI